MTDFRKPLLTVLTFAAWLTGAVSTRIEHHTNTPYPPRNGNTSVDWLSTKPARAHVEVAHITVRSSSYSIDTLKRTMLGRAHALGADAIISDMPMGTRSQRGIQSYEHPFPDSARVWQSLNGFGSDALFTPNLYILAESAKEQRRHTYVLSGIAIRFKETQNGVRESAT